MVWIYFSYRNPFRGVEIGTLTELRNGRSDPQHMVSLYELGSSVGYEFERYASLILSTDNILVGATRRFAGRREARCRSVCGSA